MSDPLRTDAARGPDDAGEPDRDARIEQLLLAGLDQYFARDYEQAINIWTRVVFLERGHSRARAYIERARSALAERQRESEELLHLGVDAFNRGDTHSARQLINQAVAQTGPNDVAMVFLERLDRLGPASGQANGKAPVRVGGGRLRREDVDPVASRRYTPWIVAGLVLLASIAALFVAVVSLYPWLTENAAARPDTVQVVDELPIVRRADMTLARARFLYGGGHLRDALVALDAIGLADPLRVEADSLRAEIQRRLLEAARPPAALVLTAPADPR